MLSIRAALPCARQFVNHSALTNKFLFDGSLKSYAVGSSFTKQYRRTFASNPPDPDQIRIYYGTLAPRMKAVKIFSITTSLTGLAAQPILLEQGTKIGGTGLAIALCTVAGFFTFVTPLLLHFITKKYVTEIHYNPKTDEYTATTISLLLYKIETKFRAGDVKVPDVPGMFTSFKIGDKAMFIDPALFEDTDHYVKIMGYDKPIDFKLDLSEDKSKPTSGGSSVNKSK